MHTYYSVDTILEDGDNPGHQIPPEFLHELTPSGLPPHKLQLKVGAIIMLLRNINLSNGLCNGTRLQIVNLSQNIICAKILTGPCIGETFFVPRIRLQVSESDSVLQFTRLQFPVCLAFAMTINKAQGQTFSKIGICLLANTFAHGQLYVALSRCRQMQSIVARLPRNQTTTANIVYPEALLQINKNVVL
jgi:ATP-dependent DNA helicase PIF1